MTTKFWLYLALHFILFLVGVFLTQSENAICGAIGASLVAAGITGWVIFLYLFVSSQAAERQMLIESTGLKEVLQYRSVSVRGKYEERLNRARKKVDILGFGQRALRQDLSSQFAKWAATVHFRILLIDPEFPDTDTPLAAIRDIEEGDPPGTIRTDVLTFVKETADLARKNSRFQIRLYRALPVINYFRIDNEAFWGPYFVGVQSRNTPTFLVNSSGFLFVPLADHFEKLWSDPQLSRSVPTEWLSDE